MSNKMSKAEIIAELDRIDSLCIQAKEVEDALDAINIDAEENIIASRYLESLKEIKEEQNKKFTVKKPIVASECLVMPPSQPNLNNSVFLGAISGMVALGCLVLVILLRLFPIKIEFLSTLAVMALFISAIYWFVKGSNDVSMFFDWQKKHEDWETAFNKTATKDNHDRFLNEFKEYDAAFNSLTEEWLKRRDEEYETCMATVKRIREDNVEELKQLQEKISKVNAEFDKVTLIHSDLFGKAYRISSMLKLGRADNLKEAINMSVEEERKDMEEAARREEARMQEELLTQQVRDNREHNAAMEREAMEQRSAIRAHNEAMERAAMAQAQAMQAQAAAAQTQARQAEAQARAQKNAAREQERMSYARCLSCANCTKCSSAAKKNSISCGGYRPR